MYPSTSVAFASDSTTNDKILGPDIPFELDLNVSLLIPVLNEGR